MEGNHPYISSGTWSLLGVKTPKDLLNLQLKMQGYVVLHSILALRGIK